MILLRQTQDNKMKRRDKHHGLILPDEYTNYEKFSYNLVCSLVLEKNFYSIFLAKKFLILLKNIRH